MTAVSQVINLPGTGAQRQLRIKLPGELFAWTRSVGDAMPIVAENRFWLGFLGVTMDGDGRQIPAKENQIRFLNC